MPLCRGIGGDGFGGRDGGGGAGELNLKKRELLGTVVLQCCRGGAVGPAGRRRGKRRGHTVSNFLLQCKNHRVRRAGLADGSESGIGLSLLAAVPCSTRDAARARALQRARGGA